MLELARCGPPLATRSAPLLVAILHLLPVVSSTEAHAQQIRQPFADSVDVELVEIDVVVTDRKGRALSGLRQDDFELYLDGAPIEIVNFFEPPIPQRRPAVPLPTTPPSGTEPASSSDSPAPASSSTVVLHLDESNLYPPNRTRLLNRLEAALDPWRSSGARFILTSFTTRLEILAPPTGDLDEILAAASRQGAGTAQAVQVAAARRQAIHSLARGSGASPSRPTAHRAGITPTCKDIWFFKMAIARDYAARSEARATASLSALADLVGVLAGVEGQKAVVHLSDGLAQRPGMSVFSYLVDQVCPHDTELHAEALSEMLQYDLSARLDRLAAEANANRVTFYPLDAAGVRTGLNQDPSFQTASSAPSARNDYIHRMNVQNGLHILAYGTGGSLLSNSNDLAELLGTARDRLARSYSLGFRAPDGVPGKLYRIDVQLAPKKARGKRTHHRRSYRSRSLDERLAERLLSVAYLGIDENPFDARIRFSASGTPDRGIVPLLVELEIPRGALEGHASASRGGLRVWLLALNRQNGTRTLVRQKTLAANTSEPTADVSDTCRIRIVMNLPEGEYTVAAGLRDEATGTMALLSKSVTVPQVGG